MQQVSCAEVSKEVVWPADINFDIDLDLLEFSIDLGFARDANFYDPINASEVSVVPDGYKQEYKYVLRSEELSKIFAYELRPSMKNTSVRAQMQDLFVQSSATYRRHGLQCIICDNQNILAGNDFSAIQRTRLSDQLESELIFFDHHLKEDFKRFMSHIIGIAKSYKPADDGPSGRCSRNDKNRSRNCSSRRTLQRFPSNHKKKEGNTGDKSSLERHPPCLSLIPTL